MFKSYQMFEKYPKNVQKLPNMLSVFPHAMFTQLKNTQMYEK